MKKCMLVSFFNSNNLGDVMIAQQLMNLTVNAGYTVTTCSYEGDFTISGYGDFPKGKISEYLSSRKSRLANILNRFIARVENLMFWRHFQSEMKMYDLLVIGGGNMIFDLSHESKSASVFAKYIDSARKQNKRTLVLSIGVGPFQTASQLRMAIEALDNCDMVTFRDSESLELIIQGSNQKHKYFLSVDPVFMLSKKKNVSQGKHGNAIGIGAINTLLFNPSQDFYQRVLRGYVNIINQLLALDREIAVFSTEKKDYCMVNDIVERCNHPKVQKVTIKSIDELMKFYSSKITILIAARMHSLIIAYTQLIPVVGLSWQQKVNSFFTMIDETDNVFPIDRLDQNLDQILKSVIKKEQEYITTVEKMDIRLQEIRERYRINVDILTKV